MSQFQNVGDAASVVGMGLNDWMLAASTTGFTFDR